MPDGAAARRQAERLADDAAKAQARFNDATDRAVRVARDVAATEDYLAETLDQLAETHPGDAARLLAKGESARGYAARERQWADDHERGGQWPDTAKQGDEHPGPG
jgi:ABC-type transporter Mla subunit MlaD